MQNNLFFNPLIYKISDLQKNWEEQCSLKIGYALGEENINLDDFRDLIKETYELIREVKEKYIFKNVCLGQETLFEFISLICTISQYALTEESIFDKSENYIFTATTLLANTLKEYAIGWKILEDILFKNSSSDGIFDFSDITDELDNEIDLKSYTYDIYEGNFSEILEFASQFANE